ncbi:CRISPR-associated protein Csn2-St [Enterococcus olivae]
MEIEIEYEFGKFLKFGGDEITYILGANHEVKWKLYRGLKRFSTGKNLSELEENVYGDDGIVIRCNGKQMKSRNLPMYFLDCRESFLEQYRYSRGSMMKNYVDSLENNYALTKQIDVINDEILKFEVELQDNFSATTERIITVMKPINYANVIKYFLELSFYENSVLYPIEMMDISMMLDDYCTLINNEIERTNKKTWIWINNPNSFISKDIFPVFIKNLKAIAEKTGLLHIFIMSEDYIDFTYSVSDISNTVVVYDDYQQLPDFDLLIESILRYYPDETKLDHNKILQALYRVFPYVGWKWNTSGVYLKAKDMVLLKVVIQLLGCSSTLYCTEEEQSLSVLEQKFLLS